LKMGGESKKPDCSNCHSEWWSEYLGKYFTFR
jgi:hypothetical protein